MSIRAEYRKFYGPAWRRYRSRLLELRGAWCRDCGRAIAKYANLSHETHDPVNSSVRIRCAACHTRADAPHRAAVLRRRRAEASGQLWLLAEIEFAATPAWALPARVFSELWGAGRQGELF
jgi:RNase P subunit RPR2